MARRYLEAVAANRAEDAIALMSAEQRRRLPLAELRRRIAALSDAERVALRDRAEKLGQGRLTAQWPSAHGALTLEHRGGNTWVVAGDLPRFDRQDTPRSALLTFARAFKNQDYATLLKLAPNTDAAELTAAKLAHAMEEPEFRRTVEATLAVLTESGAGEASGDGQWMFRSGRHRADLRLEDGRWRLVDLR